jgi:flagellar L-ring protein FlgH
MRQFLLFVVTASSLWGAGIFGHRKEKQPAPSPLDRYVQEASARPGDARAASAGSLWTPAGRLADAARDLRASQVDDVVTILVAERASAVAKGATKAARNSKAQSSITALAGATKAAGALANLAGSSGASSLDGQGATSRDVTLTTTLTARVTHVLPNGNLVLMASKDVQVNSEQQEVVVRGVIRQADLDPANQVQSARIAQLEVRINGKGVVGDAVRRPFFLYRLLLGLLPF